MSIPKDRCDFERGFFCAVAQIIKSEGLVTPISKELFYTGGNPLHADYEDQQVFIVHNLMFRHANPPTQTP